MRVVAYREFDAMVDFLGSESGVRRLILAGYYKPTSKQRSLGLEYAKVNYRFDAMAKGLTRIVGGEAQDVFGDKRMNLEWLMVAALLFELAGIYHDATNNVWMYALVNEAMQSSLTVDAIIDVIVTIINYNGLTPTVDGCVVCHARGINAFSIEQGGFLCNNHTVLKQDRNVLLGLYNLFKPAQGRAMIKQDTAATILDIVCEYLEYHGDKRLNSWRLYKEMGKM